MGQGPSEVVNHTRYAEALLTSDHWLSFEIDSSLQRFSGLDSNQELYNYKEQLLSGEGLNVVATAVEKFGAALAGFTVIPNAVGLVALVISMILEAVAKSMQKDTLGTAEMLERVFALEKAREVRDLMEEYLKILQMNLGLPQHQLTETQQIKADLSTQITRLKNSMLIDGHMNTRSMNQWVNAAAFHAQIMIHEARLKRTLQSRAHQAAGIYQLQLDRLLKKYKEYIRPQVHVRAALLICFDICFQPKTWPCEIMYQGSQSSSKPPQVIETDKDCRLDINKTLVVEEMFSAPQIAWAKTYFSDLQAIIPKLVRQKSSYIV